jgi:hypothetical protein
LIAKDYLKTLKQGTFKLMEDLGVFRDPLKAAIYVDYIPWLYSKVSEELIDGDDVEREMGGKIKIIINKIEFLNVITHENEQIHLESLN